MKHPIYIFLATLLIASLASCGSKNSPEAGTTDTTQPAMVVADTIAEDTLAADTIAEEPVAVEKPAPRRAAKPAQPKVEAKSYYVESYDAKGRVWGHVTMQGDKGTGTIHDSDENTFDVSCTRHGNELFAVDQNSRRYVFRVNF